MASVMEKNDGPGPAFEDSVFGSQAAFRVLLDAMAQPGTILAIPAPISTPTPLDLATTSAALTLFDHETSIWLGDGIANLEVHDFLRFHCGCPFVKSGLQADFAIVDAITGVPPLAQFNSGTDELPDRSTTLLVQVGDVSGGHSIGLTGPGIETRSELSVAGLPDYFWQERADQQALFPRGIDLIFCAGANVVALPRSTKVEI